LISGLPFSHHGDSLTKYFDLVTFWQVDFAKRMPGPKIAKIADKNKDAKAFHSHLDPKP
jgi:hypothetical protein